MFHLYLKNLQNQYRQMSLMIPMFLKYHVYLKNH
jgi:hypothetical protein